jgi:hypothetical protein
MVYMGGGGDVISWDGLASYLGESERLIWIGSSGRTHEIITDSFGVTEHDERVDFIAGTHLIRLCDD